MNGSYHQRTKQIEVLGLVTTDPQNFAWLQGCRVDVNLGFLFGEVGVMKNILARDVKYWFFVSGGLGGCKIFDRWMYIISLPGGNRVGGWAKYFRNPTFFLPPPAPVLSTFPSPLLGMVAEAYERSHRGALGGGFARRPMFACVWALLTGGGPLRGHGSSSAACAPLGLTGQPRP